MMMRIHEMIREQLIREVAGYLEGEGLVVKANLKGHEKPRYIKRKGGDRRILPDLTGFLPEKEFQFKITEASRLDSNELNDWKLLSDYANHKGGKLYLIILKDEKEVIQRNIDHLKRDIGTLTMGRR